MKNNILMVFEEPVAKFTASGQYATYRKLTGMEYLLIEMIRWGNRNPQKPNLMEGIEAFTIPKELRNMVYDELYGLQERKLIRGLDPKNKDAFKNILLNTLRLTEAAETATDEDSDKPGLLPVKTMGFTSEMMYFPARGTTVVGSSVDILGPSKQNISVGIPLKKYIYDTESPFGMPEHAELIGDVAHDNENVYTYNQAVEIGFSSSEGAFTIERHDTEVCPEYYVRFRTEEILSRIPEDIFSICSESVIPKWDSEAPEGDYTYILPGDFNIDGCTVRYRASAMIKADIADSSELPAESDCDMVVTDRSGRTCRYWFTEKELTLLNHKGPGRKCHVVLCQTE